MKKKGRQTMTMKIRPDKYRAVHTSPYAGAINLAQIIAYPSIFATVAYYQPVYVLLGVFAVFLTLYIVSAVKAGTSFARFYPAVNVIVTAMTSCIVAFFVMMCFMHAGNGVMFSYMMSRPAINDVIAMDTEQKFISHGIPSADKSAEQIADDVDKGGKMIVFYKFGCPDCRQTADDIIADFPDKKTYYVETRSKKGQELVNIYGVTDVPSAVVVDSAGKVCHAVLYEDVGATGRVMFVKTNADYIKQLADGKAASAIL